MERSKVKNVRHEDKGEPKREISKKLRNYFRDKRAIEKIKSRCSSPRECPKDLGKCHRANSKSTFERLRNDLSDGLTFHNWLGIRKHTLESMKNQFQPEFIYLSKVFALNVSRESENGFTTSAIFEPLRKRRLLGGRIKHERGKPEKHPHLARPIPVLTCRERDLCIFFHPQSEARVECSITPLTVFMQPSIHTIVTDVRDEVSLDRGYQNVVVAHFANFLIPLRTSCT